MRGRDLPFLAVALVAAALLLLTQREERPPAERSVAAMAAFARASFPDRLAVSGPERAVDAARRLVSGASAAADPEKEAAGPGGALPPGGPSVEPGVLVLEGARHWVWQVTLPGATLRLRGAEIRDALGRPVAVRVYVDAESGRALAARYDPVVLDVTGLRRMLPPGPLVRVTE